MRKLWIGSMVLAGMLASGCAMTPAAPALPSYHAMLAPAAGVTSTGKGMGMFTYDPATHTLTYDVTYEGLTGAAIAAHIHGPAAEGANAGPVVLFPTAASPIKGTATLTDVQAADLEAGKYYVNVHTAANKGGEIRGTIVAK